MEIDFKNDKKNHAIFLSLPLQGHINPFVHLALKLASRGFTITFLIFEHVHQQITRARSSRSDSEDIFDRARVGSGGFDIRYHVISDGLPLDFDRTTRLDEYLEWFLEGEMYDHVDKVVGEIVLDSKPTVDLLVVDTLYPWTSKLAKKFGLRLASFWTEPALVFNLYYHVHLLREHGHLNRPDNRKDPIEYIPGVDSILPKDLPSYLQDIDTSTNMHKFIFRSFEDAHFANYVLCNTVQALEPESILALQSLIPFYPIGPILLHGHAKSLVPTSLWAESSCNEWLRSKPNGSVLYVSFGSLANLTKNDVLEIAYGLMLSNVDFVWVLRPCMVVGNEVIKDVLPPRFEEEVRGRGVVVSWTDQISVLSDSAIGGFLTHCGWNSVLESIWCEVPMLCFPVFSDQLTNAKLVVKDWKVGINLCEEKSIHRESIAAQMKKFMGETISGELRSNIKLVRNILHKAVEANGSSEKNIDLLIETLK